MTTASRTRVAIVGLGMAVTPHAQSLRDLADRVEVAGAFSRTPKRRGDFAQRFAFPVTDDLEALARDRSIAAVLILTPPRTHLPLVERFAAAGKHVLLEKPLEADTARAEAVVEACERAGVRLAVDHGDVGPPAGAAQAAHGQHDHEQDDDARDDDPSPRPRPRPRGQPPHEVVHACCRLPHAVRPRRSAVLS